MRLTLLLFHSSLHPTLFLAVTLETGGGMGHYPALDGFRSAAAELRGVTYDASHITFAEAKTLTSSRVHLDLAMQVLGTRTLPRAHPYH